MAAARAASSSPPSSPWSEPEELLLDEHMRRQALIVRGGSQPLRLVEHAPSLGQPAAFDQRGAQLDEQLDPPRIVGGEQPGNPLEQADRRGQVAADERPPSRRPRAARTPGRRGRPRASRAIRSRHGTGKPAPGGSRRSPRTRAAVFAAVQLEPGGEALVQVGARLLRQRAIGGIANQSVTEAVSLLAGEVRCVGADQVPADKRQQPVLEYRIERGASKCADCALVKHRAFDRRGRQDRALIGREALETGGQECVDRRGDRQLREVRRGRPSGRPRA